MIVPSKLVCMTSINSARSVRMRLFINVIPAPELGKRQTIVGLGFTRGVDKNINLSFSLHLALNPQTLPVPPAPHPRLKGTIQIHHQRVSRFSRSLRLRGTSHAHSASKVP